MACSPLLPGNYWRHSVYTLSCFLNDAVVALNLPPHANKLMITNGYALVKDKEVSNEKSYSHKDEIFS